MKKLLIALISVVLLLTLCSCSESSHLKFKLKDDGTYSVSGKLSAQFQEEIVIPETYKGKPVTEIADNAFDVHVKFFNAFGIDVNRIINVTIPDSITSIGDHAFYSCKSLESIIIPDGVTSIGDYAFYDCNSLKSIFIPSNVVKVGISPFTGINVVGTSHSVKPSGWMIAYADVWGVDNINVTDDGFVWALKDGNAWICAYSGDRAEALTIPTTIDGYTVTGINAEAFSFYFLKSVTIPDTVTYIGIGAFDGCSNLIYNKFDNAYYLGNDSNPYLYLAKTERYSGCIINDNTKVIDSKAFWRWNYDSITIPASVVYIGEYISEDSYSSSLASITVHDDNQYYTSIDGSLYTKDGKTLIRYAPKNTSSTVVIPEGVTKIADRAFYGAKNLKSIIIPDTVTDIGHDVFKNCDSNLTVYCEAESRPGSWSKDWNLHSDGKYYIPVVWGYTGE